MQAQFVESIITTLDHELHCLQVGQDKEALLGRLSSDWQDLIALAGEQNYLGLADLLAFYVELQEQFIADKTSLNDHDWLFLSQGVALLKMFLQTGDAVAMTELLEFLQYPLWINPVAAEDIAYLQDLLATDRQLLAEPEILPVPAVTTAGAGQSSSDEVGDDEGGFCQIDPELLVGQMTVDAALANMVGGQCVLLLQQWQAPANVPDLLAKTLEALQPIIRATETIQLWGGKWVLSGLLKNLQCYQEDMELIGDATPLLFEQAFAAISRYFQDMTAPSNQAALIEVFENPEWPFCLSEGQSAFLKQLFAQVQLAAKPVIAVESVAGQDMSLDIPDEVDPQLLDMVFLDLPAQTEDFAKFLHQFLKTKDREALHTAQRVAHTVKGLANMLGVKGLATLTHRLEDILELLHGQGLAPDNILAEALVEASDCLAAMGEALLMRTSAPEMSLVVLQKLADAHYRLQTGEISEMGETGAAFPEPPNGIVAEPAVGNQGMQDTVSREETYIRVPKNLLENLFRIAGEVKILDAQLDEQLKQVRSLLKSGGVRYRTLQRVITDLEQLIATGLNNQVASTAHDYLEGRFDHLEMNRFNEMHSSISRLYEATADSREIECAVENYLRKMHASVLGLTQLHEENLENILDTRLVPVESLTPRLQRTLRQACRMAGKQAELTVVGEDTLIDSQILNQLADPLMHIIRNAVDHGLETPEYRLQAGKPENGQITLSFAKETDRIVVVCADDGQGINRLAIRQVALSKGLVEPTATLNDQDIDRLILIPGFSTSASVSQLSGRGIGMDVVYQEIIRLKGKLEIYSSPGQGCQFTLSIPSSSLLLKATLAQCGAYTLSIIQYGIDQTIPSDEGEFHEAGEDMWFHYQGERYQAYGIESLVGVPAPYYARKTDFHVLLVNLGQGEKVAVMVEKLLDSRDLVFKDLGRYVPHNPAIPGVTILADGQVSAVLDLPEALRHKSTYNQRIMAFVAQTVVKKLPKILVVDDSLSARKSLATLLKDSGYEVATAIDGQDALSQIEASQPDLVITDMEMPRMNGVELTATLKQQRRTAKLPVLMVTSRSTDKHRMEAGIVGVNAYLTKPWSETELLQQIEALL
ncbi:MAG: response regulator [Methylovulum sp.]|uniref:hybrid sensor histidine kinase/response regulator n=1 Tax=Methylovulum sp. TaxID=1916980 RepID=UPI00260F865C|nr:response regulator [Methylovulum sp.]MDD2722829.1 response regulator [Methylovulum sp.]MDD5124409.1 response regulator [Methylovulum sp.]